MRKLLILNLITTAVLGDASKAGDLAFEWKSSSQFPNGTVVQACVGDNVTLPWVLEMTSPVDVSIEWSKTSEDNSDQENALVLASYVGNTFYGLEPEKGLEFLPNAGIMLPKVTLADTGLYKVEIIVLGHPKLYKQVAFLHVSDIPVTTTDELHAFILPESVYNSTTGLWHVQLGCRPPVTRGQLALPVIWTTPSNRTAISTSYNNKTFILALPLPMEEGDYSCSLNRSVPAVKCLSTLFNTSRAATVNVKGVNTRLSYLEGSVETLWKETADLNGSLCHLTGIVQQLQTKDKTCDEDILNLNQTTENINSVLQNLQTKNDKMTSKINNLESITTTAQIKYDNMSVMVLNKFDNLADVIQRENSSMITFVQSTLDDISTMVQENNDTIAAMVQRNNDNITTVFQSKFDNITSVFQSKFDNMTAMVQRNNDNITAVVQRNNDNITAMVQSKFDNITAMVQRNNDNITAMVQSKFDNITAMAQSKFDNVNDIILQLQSSLIQLLNIDLAQRPASCADVQKYDNMSGAHTLIVNDNKRVKVYCDQSTDNDGWTVIQRRQDGSVDFYRNWEQYEIGFGDLNGEFWIGLANLYHLTTNKNSKLRVDLTDFDGSTAYAMYNTFNINGAQDNYQLNVGGYTGTAELKDIVDSQFAIFTGDNAINLTEVKDHHSVSGDSLEFHNRMKFSTFDSDHDTAIGNCALMFHSAWWNADCYRSSLNGRYMNNSFTSDEGVSWYHWKSDWRSLKRVEMKIKS